MTEPKLSKLHNTTLRCPKSEETEKDQEYGFRRGTMNKLGGLCVRVGARTEGCSVTEVGQCKPCGEAKFYNNSSMLHLKNAANFFNESILGSLRPCSHEQICRTWKPVLSANCCCVKSFFILNILSPFINSLNPFWVSFLLKCS